MTHALSEAVAGRLRQALAVVCGEIGADASSARLVKYTMNAVYVVGPYVVRLAHGDLARERAWRVSRAATALEAAGVATVRLARDVAPRPVQAGQWIGTVWQRVAVTDAEPKPVDVAGPLRAIHALDRLAVELPMWSPVDKFRRRIDSAASLPLDETNVLGDWSRSTLGVDLEELLATLRRRCDGVAAALADVDWRLPWGVVHGDAHTGNALLCGSPHRPAADPTTVLCDLDSICVGPREWDLVPTAHGPARFGRSRTDYLDFVDAYGFDVTAWSGWPVLRDVRELQLVTSVLDGVAGRPAIGHELAHRLRSYLAGDHTAVWTRYR